MSAVLELEDYLKEEKPDIMGIIETKLASEGDILNIGEGKHNLWMRSRKNKWGGGVMLLVRKDLLGGICHIWGGGGRSIENKLKTEYGKIP